MKPKLPKINKGNAKAFFRKNGSTIMIVLAGAASLTGVATAIYATPKAVILIDERKEELDVEKLDAVETVKTVWKLYLPTAAAEVLCLTFLTCAATNNHKHTAALSTAYALSESAFREYRDKVIDTIGEKKEKAIRDEVAKDRVAASQSVIIETPKNVGDQYCYDYISDRHFYSTVQKIKSAQNELNDQMVRTGVGGCAYLNDFYELIGLRGTKFGADAGWDYYKNGLIDVDLDVILKDDIPCLVIDFDKNRPQYL